MEGDGRKGQYCYCKKQELKRVLSFEQLEGYDQTIFVNVMKDVCDKSRIC